MARRDVYAKCVPVKDVSVIMPAYNECKTVAKALNSVVDCIEQSTSDLKFELIIVESNSDDSTRREIQDWILTQGILSNTLVIKAIFQEKALGKGNAVRAGLKQAKGDVVTIFDADEEYDFKDILSFIPEISRGTTSFVLGNRHSKDSYFSIRSFPEQKSKEILLNLGHWILALYMSILVRQILFDPFTMWKVFRREVFQNIELEGDKFDFDWELVIKASRVGSRFIEVPCAYVSRDFTQGKKIRIVKDPIQWVFKSIKYRFGRI